MTLPPSSADPVFRIHLTLAQYPILRTRIRARMQAELFERGIISPMDFNQQVREQAMESQLREGLADPFGEEPGDVWSLRLDRIRTNMIDIYFAQNLSYELFEDLVKQVLEERGAWGDWLETFNAEMAPQELIFEQAIRISQMPPEERKGYQARLEELKVVMIRNMISDQLAYIKIAKRWFRLSDLLDIRERKIGKGKIGGKAAGMLLAQRILAEVGDEDVRRSIDIPESYFLAADVMYAFMAYNNLLYWNDQKYKSADEIHEQYPQAHQEYLQGRFPPDIFDELQNILLKIGNKPIIVRSSSLLEDNFGTSFAGKYESFFCPNQGTQEENLEDFAQAIIKVYASALAPDPLLYRRSKDLQDYDERIAVLIQEVQGERFQDYFFPHAAGVAFSRNLFRWSPEIERDAGFLRLVWGLGTRAVDRVGNDYPRLVALSHPILQTHADPRSIRRYSQRMIDLIDMKKNIFTDMPVNQVLHREVPHLRLLVQHFREDFLASLRTNMVDDKIDDLVLTFEDLLSRTPMADKMKRMLQTLEREYHSPVDLEFTIQIVEGQDGRPDVQVKILQCRPQSHLQEVDVRLPGELPEHRLIFSTGRVLPHGHVEGVDYVLFVPPEGYFDVFDNNTRIELARAIGRVNSGLEGKRFICIGPGRWGTVNPDLGVKAGYADIYHASALIEMSGSGVGSAPEPSFGTHFFQDLIECSIYPLAIFLDDEDVVFNRTFFYDTPNQLVEMFPREEKFEAGLRLIRVQDYLPGSQLELVMDSEEGRAVAFLSTKRK